MPKEATIGRLLLENAVPESVRGELGVLDKKGIARLATALAALGPDVYRETMKKLTEVSTRGGYEGGGYSFGPEDMIPGPQARALREDLKRRVAAIRDNPGLDPKTRDNEIARVSLEAMQPLQEAVLGEARAAGNPLAKQVDSGAKGSGVNLRALTTGDVVYTDQNYRPIPYPIIHSFAEGLRPFEFMASCYGARQSIALTKLGTAKGGYLCLSVGTMVAMADGTDKAIELIQVGDMVVGSDNTGRTFPVKVSATFANGLRECRRYVFRELASRKSRVSLVATSDHKVLARLAYGNLKTRSGNLLARDLQPTPLKRVSTYFEAQPSLGGQWGGVFEPRAAILGVMLGDGYLGREGRGSASALQLSCADPILIGDMLPDYEALGLQLKPASGYAWMVTRPDTRAGRNPLAEWLRELGLFGVRSTKKFIPPVVWTWDDESIAEFIGGLIATDGSVQSTTKGIASGHISFASVSLPMITTLRRLLSLRLGVNTTPPTVQTPDRHASAVNDLWTLGIGFAESLRRFAERVPVPGVKRQRVADALTHLENNPPREYRQAFRPFPKECVDVGLVETYDIEVDHPDHLYVLSNGLIVSNSKRLGNMAHRLVVTAPDGPSSNPDDTPTGFPVPTNDPDNENAFLAHPVGGYERNTHLTRDVLADLQKKGIGKILVRSPLVGGPGDGGVYGLDVGIRERNRIAPVGDFVGRAASDAVSEPTTQSIIGCLSIGTMVRMADGSEKAIEKIEPGEFVLGAWQDDPQDSHNGQRYQNLNTGPVLVTNRFDNGVRACRTYDFTWLGLDDTPPIEITLTATPNHKVLAKTSSFQTPNRHEPLYDLRPLSQGDDTLEDDDLIWMVRRWGAESPMLAGFLSNYTTDMSDLPTYDIEVDHPQSMFVLANGLIVSNSKHSGGVAGTTGVQQGFDTIERMFSAPSVYQGGVAHAQRDGMVTSVREAPQGGHYVVVDNEEHYVHPDRKPTVHVGAKVEAGDPLSDGILNPSELVRHKGIGEARRQFVNEFLRVGKDSGVHAHRRNVELVTRGYMDHVHIDKEYGEYAPGEIAPYTALAAEYEPREGHERVKPDYAKGMYLERPALHYSIGTRLTPSVIGTLNEHGVGQVVAHKEPPPFSPILIRSNDSLAHDRDFSTQMLGSNLYSSLIKSVGRGATMDPTGTSYVPALAAGVNFGAPGTKTRGWDVPPKPPVG